VRAVNKKATEVIDLMLIGIDENNSHRRIDNNTPDSAYMPVSVEWVGDCRIGDVFSIAHYFERNGDLMADPEMTFLRGPDGKYYPLSYKLDEFGVYREGVRWIGGEPKYINMAEQRDEAIFAGTWMENIKTHQFSKNQKKKYLQDIRSKE